MKEAEDTSAGKTKETEDFCITYFDPKPWSHRYPVSCFTATLPSYRKAAAGHFEFEIWIRCNDLEWRVHRRFSEFVALWSSMSKLEQKLPELPPKTWSFTHKKEDEVLEKRHAGLGVAMRQLLRLQGATSQSALRLFLELDEHKP